MLEELQINSRMMTVSKQWAKEGPSYATCHIRLGNAKGQEKAMRSRL
jgi:hypothetical protein